jgi:ADP-heptose:LPS heptosyltransferase
MNILVLQMKRIGDLVLTTPVFTALRAQFPESRITIVADGPCASLLPAVAGVDERLVYSRCGDNRDVWRAVRRGGWDVCLDFTETDRSALMTLLSRAKQRVTFAGTRWLRRLAYRKFVDSPVRLSHTCDRYLELLRPLGIVCGENETPMPELHVAGDDRAVAFVDAPAALPGESSEYVLIHPGTARAEKYWPAGRWADVIHALRRHGHRCAITCGPDAFESAHVEEVLLVEKALSWQINPEAPGAFASPWIARPAKLSHLAALVEKARIVLSCDTSVVHLAAALRRPQIALFGPTNPFHWRPRHERAVVISATQPDSPLTAFQPKMKGAPMDRIPTATVIAAAEALLSAPR